MHRVLDGLHAQIGSGERVAIMGRSGSGKSTLLNLISGIDRADNGTVSIDGVEVTALGEPALLLADEPTGNLDDETAGEVLPVLLSLTRERGATLLMVTHDETLAASADRVLELREGRLRERQGPQAAGAT